MLTKDNWLDKHKGRSWGGKIVLLTLAITIGWYLVVRLTSPWNAVRLITLNRVRTPNWPVAKGGLRTAIYNIAHGRGGKFGLSIWAGGDRSDKIRRIRQMAHLLKQARPDVLVLNEVDFSAVWSGHLDQAKLIAQEMGYAYLAEQRSVDAAIPFCKIRSGNALLSRYPISKIRFVEYPVYSMFEKLAGGSFNGLLCTLKLPDGQSVRVLAVHLEWRSEAVRVGSARKILEIERESDIPLIAMGDFNSSPPGYVDYFTDESGDNAMEVLLESGQFATLPMGTPPAPEDFTFPSERPDQVIDWILVSKPWKISEKQVIPSDLSDHFPVVARVMR